MEYFHSPASLVLPWCLSLRQLEVRMQRAPQLRKTLPEFPRSLLPQRSMDTITCWRFPHANKAKRRSLFRQECFITSPGLRGNKIAFPHETEADNFIWLLAQNDWNETPATGCKGSEKFINSPANVKWRDEVPSTETSWWLHVTCFCLHRYQVFFMAEKLAPG